MISGIQSSGFTSGYSALNAGEAVPGKYFNTYSSHLRYDLTTTLQLTWTSRIIVQALPVAVQREYPQPYADGRPSPASSHNPPPPAIAPKPKHSYHFWPRSPCERRSNAPRLHGSRSPPD